MQEEGVSVKRLNWLRAAVLGANDGVVSVASIVVGVAGATHEKHTIFIAGLAGLVAGAFSMAVGEYVSVSSQRDSERAYIAKEKRELAEDPEGELKELAAMYEAKGLSAVTAKKVADELTAHDPVKAHLDIELNLDEEDLNNPTQAAIASMVSFTAGGIIPLVAILLAVISWRVPVTFIAVFFCAVPHRLPERDCRRRLPPPRNAARRNRRPGRHAGNIPRRPPLRHRRLIVVKSPFNL